MQQTDSKVADKKSALNLDVLIACSILFLQHCGDVGEAKVLSLCLRTQAGCFVPTMVSIEGFCFDRGISPWHTDPHVNSEAAAPRE